MLRHGHALGFAVLVPVPELLVPVLQLLVQVQKSFEPELNHEGIFWRTVLRLQFLFEDDSNSCLRGSLEF